MVRTEPGYNVFYELEGGFDLGCKTVCDENYLEVKAEGSFKGTGPRYCCDLAPFSGPQKSASHELVHITPPHPPSGHECCWPVRSS